MNLSYIRYYNNGKWITEFFVHSMGAVARAEVLVKKKIITTKNEVVTIKYKNQWELVEQLNSIPAEIRDWKADEQAFLNDDDYEVLHKTLKGFYHVPDPYAANLMHRIYYICQRIFLPK